MSDLTIPAHLVAEGVESPPVWRCVDPPMWLDLTNPGESILMSLADPQTAYGVALQLDAWERAGGMNKSYSEEWSALVAVAASWGMHRVESVFLLRRLIARLTHIGMDHAIRRALGWEIRPGSLATLTRKEPDDKPWWCLTAPHDSGPYRPMPTKKRQPTQLACLEYRAEPWSDAYLHVPGLAGVTLDTEAIAVIRRRVVKVFNHG